MNQNSLLNLEQISKDVRERYSTRYKTHGYSPLSLGWDSRDHQITRFEKVTKIANLNGKQVLDIGCGFGDFLSFLDNRLISYSYYIGWDTVDYFIAEAKSRHSNSKSRFEVCDIITLPINSQPIADVSIMLGLLNWNLGSKEKNIQFTKFMINKAFLLSRYMCIVDFLSSNLDPSYPPEANVFYHDPSEVIQLVSTHTQNFILAHDYPCIPQKEFMVALLK
ncbi:class I SAM-dependent methyltransferase [Thermosynechococcus sp. JY1334]|uniref:class I SAM-dependent methyltransferase n=1 Tax=unclassified Thermosynechococcus TaxID=2622553 RepID=UPI00267373A1|nr:MULTISPECIES: class I SAM-dependent methyltransferase [unclassified Thermosynechococcus]MDR5637915.1 class I SAM-dependent methyltransferase [Thermosynechococcus sp. PP42]MDR7896832.1 class I SAM-dependent methyltransferase [Thermosynechococcus sp. JY1332]MDR7904229.1 class I SAM-dependent methyltransferase [Thermosynechococcus sp. JY1334]WKT86481.1 class I SAM-dependent methyltransferase [Thermosynechococcus sp. JY1339]WNC55426.1 class I SAM-dependent methyltransferase [Thermosynechococcus